MDEDVGEADEGHVGMDRYEPSAIAEIEEYARHRHDDDDHVGRPVQQHVEAAEAHLACDRHDHHARLLQRIAARKPGAPHVDEIGRGREEQREAGQEMPGPDFALRQDRVEPVRDRSAECVGRDPDAGEQADDERDRRHPVQRQRADIGARRLLAPVRGVQVGIFLSVSKDRDCSSRDRRVRGPCRPCCLPTGVPPPATIGPLTEGEPIW